MHVYNIWVSRYLFQHERNKFVESSSGNLHFLCGQIKGMAGVSMTWRCIFVSDPAEVWLYRDHFLVCPYVISCFFSGWNANASNFSIHSSNYKRGDPTIALLLFPFLTVWPRAKKQPLSGKVVVVRPMQAKPTLMKTKNLGEANVMTTDVC